MHEELEREVEGFLEEKYGSEFVARQPTLTETGVLRPDFVVYRDKEHTEPFLVVEAKMRRSGGRQREAARQVQRYLQRLDTVYGAVVYEDMKYVFELVEVDGDVHEIPLADFPPFDTTPSEAVRGIDSVDEFWFLINRVQSITEVEYIELLQHLYRKFEADNCDRYVSPDSEGFDSFIQELDHSINDRHEAYSPSEAPIDSPLLTTVFHVFASFDLEATALTVRKSITDAIYENQLFDTSSGTFATPPIVAEQLVELADISESDRVLDPASGWGYMLREANKHTESTYGVEIDKQTTNVALFFEDFTGGTTTYMTGDFFDIVQTESTPLPSELDQIILDPPLGTDVPSETVDQLDVPDEARSAEAFVIVALSLLKDGGTLTTVLPTSLLSDRRSQWFRKRLCEEYDLQVIVEIGDAKLFPFIDSRYSLSIAQIRKDPPTNETTVAVVEKDGDPETALADTIERVKSRNHRILRLSSDDTSFVPSERLATEDIERELRKQYDDVTPLSDVATIEGGVSYPGEKDEAGVPFLEPTDDVDETLDKVPVSESTPLATETDILLLLKGPHLRVLVPNRAVVPSSDWGIARLESADAAQVYATFLESEDGQRQLEAMQQGSAIPYLPLSKFGKVLVPVYDEDEIAAKADQIRSIRSQLNELEAAKDEVAEELREVF